LQNCFICCYPGRTEIAQELQELATSLGGQLPLPTVPWKYVLIKELFGFAAAHHTQLYYNQVKCSMLRGWDKIMHSVERLDRPSAKTIG
jgi:hypothetical protein